MRLTRFFAPGIVVAVSLSIAAFGQQSPESDDSYDPDSASRGVARISLMNGDITVRRGDSGDVVAAAINAPLVAGDRILTGPNSRAEVQLDWANMIRVGPESEIRLSELGDRQYQVQLARGLSTFRVLRASQADVEISTPLISIRPRKEGAYRIIVRDDGQTELTVRSGEVEVFTPSGAETLRSGRTMLVRGSLSDPEFQVVSAAGDDEWDRWNRSRDKDLER
jgi:ferric-dicitrate binding protein FerR (iron transport regulator)